MIPYLRILGAKNSGKTSLIEALIRELSARGWRVGTIKHDAHDFDIDRPGKDSWRHRQAGSAATVIFSQTQLALVRSIDAPPPLSELLAAYFGERVSACDLVLVEGCRREPGPAIRLGDPRPNELVAEGELLATLPRGYDLDPAQLTMTANLIETTLLRGRRG